MRYYLRAPAIAGGSTDQARAPVVRIAQIDRAEGYRALAEFHVAQDELPQAVAPYRHAVAELPDNLDLAFEYGLFLQRIEDWDTAYAQFSGMIARAPERMDAYYQVGRNAVLSGTRLDEGDAALRHYLTQEPATGDPSRAWAHTRLGQVYRRMNRVDDARREFRAALALEPRHEEARNQLAALR
jgi:Tfp pilus assembly protein PilF